MNKTNLSKLFKIIFALLFVLIVETMAQDFFSSDNRLRFGNYLFCDGDYIRAVDEFEAHLKKNDNDTVRFKLAYSLARLERYNEAGSHYNLLSSNSSLMREAKLEYLKTFYFSGTFSELRDLRSSPNYSKSAVALEAGKLTHLSYLYPNEVLPDSTIFFEPFNQREKKELLKFYLRKQSPGYKSEVTAALFSAVIPGLGKVYTERYTEGLTSFLLTGLMTFLSINNFNADHDFRGWLFAGLAAYFYAGNIYGSAASAQIYNAGIRFNFENDLKIFLNNNNHFMPKYDFLCE